MLSGIDYAVVIAYLVGIMVLGLYFARFVRSADDFFLSGKTLPFWAVGMSIVATDISAMDFVGVSGQSYRFGMAVGNFDWLGSMPAMLLAAFIFIPYFWKAGLYTIPEYLGRRYNDYVRAVASMTWIIFFALDLGVLFWATAVMFKPLMGWDPWFSIIVTAVVVGLYTFFGGLTAVVMTDVVQMIIMFVGGATVVVVGLYHAGGWSGLTDKIAAHGRRLSEPLQADPARRHADAVPVDGHSLRTDLGHVQRLHDRQPGHRAALPGDQERVACQGEHALRGVLQDVHPDAGHVSGTDRCRRLPGDGGWRPGVSHAGEEPAAARTARTAVRRFPGRSDVHHRLDPEFHGDPLDQGRVSEVHQQGRQ